MLTEEQYSVLVSNVLKKEGLIVRSEMIVGTMCLRLYICYKQCPKNGKDQKALVVISTPIEIVQGGTKPLEFNHYETSHLNNLIEAIDRYVQCINIEALSKDGISCVYVKLKAFIPRSLNKPNYHIKACLDNLLSEWYTIYNIIVTLAKDNGALLQAQDIDIYFQNKKRLTH